MTQQKGESDINERNYHTHTKLCGHAKGTTEDYVKEAVKKKLKALGMSEHGPFPGDAFEQRMKFADFRWYIENLQELKEVYKDQIEIFTGLDGFGVFIHSVPPCSSIFRLNPSSVSRLFTSRSVVMP